MPASQIVSELAEVQAELKVPKSQSNEFGGFLYRSKEDILEAAKPLCAARGMALLVDDEVVVPCDGRVYVCATASVLKPDGTSVSARGWAREPAERKGMDPSQVTGSASSYAGKRALGNLFALDDAADPDAQGGAAPAEPEGPVVGRCRSCGARYTFGSAAEMRAYAGCCASPDYEVEGAL